MDVIQDHPTTPTTWSTSYCHLPRSAHGAHGTPDIVLNLHVHYRSLFDIVILFGWFDIDWHRLVCCKNAMFIDHPCHHHPFLDLFSRCSWMLDVAREIMGIGFGDLKIRWCQVGQVGQYGQKDRDNGWLSTVVVQLVTCQQSTKLERFRRSYQHWQDQDQNRLKYSDFLSKNVLIVLRSSSARPAKTETWCNTSPVNPTGITSFYRIKEAWLLHNVCHSLSFH